MADDTQRDELDATDADADVDTDADYPPPRDLSREAALVSAGLSVVAGVLCVVAPFRAVYTLHRTLNNQRVSIGVDGWGRYSIPLAQHGPRYGLMLTLAFLVLVLSAATQIAGARRPDAPADPDATDGSDRLALGLSVAGAALLTGILGIIALDVQTTVSNSEGGDTSTTLGAMIWVLVGAWLVSLLALYVPWFEARRRL